MVIADELGADFLALASSVRTAVNAAAGVRGQTYVHREQIPLWLLKEGLEKLDYAAVEKVLNHR